MITVYTASHCAYCKPFKEWLASKGIEFEEVSFDENPELYPAQYRIFPLTKIGDNFVEGLNLGRIAELLNL